MIAENFQAETVERDQAYLQNLKKVTVDEVISSNLAGIKATI